MHSPLSSCSPVVITVLLVLFCSPGFSGEFYKWTDDNGNVNFSDSLDKVPEKYRNQIESRRFGNGDEEGGENKNIKTSPPESLERPHGQRRVSEAENQTAQPLKRYEVPYKPYEGSARRVIVDAKFNGSVTAPMAIDTGAPGTVISIALAKKLGLLDESHGRLFAASGIGGTARALRSIIDDIQVGEARSHFIPTTITAEISKSFDGLLGLDFFPNYSITIDAKRKVVVFEEIPADPDNPGGHDQEWWTGVFKEFAASREGWKNVSIALDKKIRESTVSGDAKLTAQKDFAEYQYGEAEKLFDKLNKYARENAVPMHWRQY